jgi:polysaccharide biosynthesis protein PslH
MKVLFISKQMPSRSSGISVKISALLRCLSSVSTVICAFIVDEKKHREEYCDCGLNITSHYLKTTYHSNPVLRYSDHLREILYPSKKVKDELSRIIDSERPDIIWLEFGYICELIPHLKKFNLPIIYGSHNSQFKLDYRLCMTNQNYGYKLKMAPMVALYYVHERVYFRMADLILCISPADTEYYSKMIDPSKIRYLPMFLDDQYLSSMQASKSDHRFVSLVGSLRSYQNYSAALHALEEVWPVIQRKNRELFLYIIGELPPADSMEMKKLTLAASRVSNVVLTGHVDSVIPYVKAASVNIAPTLIGSGIRTKILESIACRTPVVSTSIGAEGLPFTDGHSIQISNNPEEFAEKVLELIIDSNMRAKIIDNAYQIYQEQFSHEAGIRSLQSVLQTALSRSENVVP